MNEDKISAINYVKNGDRKLLVDDYRGALADYSNAIKLRPEFADAYFNRGRAKHGLGDYKGAIDDYSKAVELEPAHAKHYCFRGGIKSEYKDYHGAIGDFTKTVELDPNYAMAYFNRAIAFLGIGQKIEAVADFLKAKQSGIRIPQGVWERCT